MAHIKIKRGLDIPISGQPSGDQLSTLHKPQSIALNLAPFEGIRFKLLVSLGDKVTIGEPLAYDKECPARKFVSPASGVISEFLRGEKRRLLNIVIDLDDDEGVYQHQPLDFRNLNQEQIIERLAEGGLFAHIRQRPFDILANPQTLPRSIFVKAIETAPLATPPKLSLRGKEDDFQVGLSVLNKIAPDATHLVYSAKETTPSLVDAIDVVHHTVSGPHPAGNASVHIHHIDPIKTSSDVVWTLELDDVAAVGAIIARGTYLFERVISIAGPGIEAEKRGYFKGRLGFPIGELIAGRNAKGLLRLISGCVLMGDRVDLEDFLHFHHNIFTVLPENSEREIFHFLRPATHYYSATRTTHSGLFHLKKRRFAFSTRQHGEHRYFVDGTVYEKVMPMRIPVMPLIRAVQAKDDELCEQLGLLEVAPEDFALPAFVCPCKMEMPIIIKEALMRAAKQMV